MPLSPKRVGSVAYSLVMFVLVSVLAGVLVAGLFVPAAGLAGLGARTGSSKLENLPADLATPPPSQRSTVLLADGSVLANFYDENRVYVPLKDIAPVMRQAQVAIEDHRFYEHGAIDPLGTLRALLHNSASGSTQGASSLTQQYVKMVQIETAAAKGDEAGVRAAQAPTYARKIQELRYAVAMEHKYTKDQILERYLNIAYYGDGAYGVEAAAHHYFDTTAAKLTLPQAAMLAGAVQDPNNVNPVANKRAATDRRDVVLNQMVKWNMVGEKAAAKAKKTKFNEKKVTSVRNGCEGTRYPFLCDYVRRDLLTNSSLGKTLDDRENLLNRGGLTIQTEIDPKIQDTAQKAISNKIDPKDPVISVLAMVQPGTGLIRAMAQNRPVMGKKAGQTYYDYAVKPSMGGAEGYQAGSTFKAFTAAAALNEGIPLKKKFDAKPHMQFGGKQFESCDGTFTLGGSYEVSNSTGRNGVMDMQTAANYSVNTYFMQLEQAAGLCDVTKMAKKAGVELSSNAISWDDYSHYPSFTLGSAEVSPLSMAEAYATFAARGLHCDPHIVKSVLGEDGKKFKVATGNCKQVMDKDVADAVNKMLKGVINDGTGRRARVPGSMDQAGKTGTTDSNRAVWFIGYTPEIAAAAMIAIDPTAKYWKSHRDSLKGMTLPQSHTWLEGSGSGDAGQWIWKPAMTEALKHLPHTKFHKASNDLVNGKTVDVPHTSGMSPSEIEKALKDAGFNVAKKNQYSDSVPAGYFMYISPSDRALQYSTITMYYSAGKDPAKVAADKKAAENKKKAEEKKKTDSTPSSPAKPPDKKKPKKPGG